MSQDHAKSYRWCLYILLLVIGYWIGLSKAGKPSWIYVGPDLDKADQAWIYVLTGVKP